MHAGMFPHVLSSTPMHVGDKRAHARMLPYVAHAWMLTGEWQKAVYLLLSKGNNDDDESTD